MRIRDAPKLGRVSAGEEKCRGDAVYFLQRRVPVARSASYVLYAASEHGQMLRFDAPRTARGACMPPELQVWSRAVVGPRGGRAVGAWRAPSRSSGVKRTRPWAAEWVGRLYAQEAGELLQGGTRRAPPVGGGRRCGLCDAELALERGGRRAWRGALRTGVRRGRADMRFVRPAVTA